MTTDELLIGNVGTGPLMWNIQEEQPVHVLGGDPVQDGGFEAGSPNPFWDEFSTNFGTPLCTVDLCGSGGGSGPHSGQWWAWFGGIDAYEEGLVSQDVTIPASASASLNFWLEIPSASGTGQDYMDVMIDGDVILTFTDLDASNYVPYREVIVDISAYADGGTHTLSFHSEIFGGGTTNFFVDDVSITAEPGGGGECTQPTDVPWLNVAPDSGTTQPGEVDSVTVTYNSNGLGTGMYTALLCISSNDPDEEVVGVPVTLTVESATAVTVDNVTAQPRGFGLGMVLALAGVGLVLGAGIVRRYRRQ